jgi:transcriptional regulator with XRE-family HTH domain
MNDLPKRKAKFRIYEQLTKKAKRDGASLTPSDIARAIGASHNTILAYARNETVRVNLVLLGAMCDYLDCSIEDLMYLEDEEGEEAEIEEPELMPV